jgi:hypothetical protein
MYAYQNPQECFAVSHRSGVLSSRLRLASRFLLDGLNWVSIVSTVSSVADSRIVFVHNELAVSRDSVAKYTVSFVITDLGTVRFVGDPPWSRRCSHKVVPRRANRYRTNRRYRYGQILLRSDVAVRKCTIARIPVAYREWKTRYRIA